MKKFILSALVAGIFAFGISTPVVAAGGSVTCPSGQVQSTPGTCVPSGSFTQVYYQYQPGSGWNSVMTWGVYPSYTSCIAAVSQSSKEAFNAKVVIMCEKIG